MQWEDYITLWNHAAVKVFDIRRIVMQEGEGLQDYRLPANGFIYCVRGAANLMLDDVAYQPSRFYLIHGAKGNCLTITAKDEFEFYMLFYRAKLVSWRGIQLLLERRDALEVQYGFVPHEPLGMRSLMVSMEQILRLTSGRGSLQVKGLFYQFVSEVLQNLEAAGHDEHDKLDLVSQAVRYMHVHYHETISLESLANLLNYSPRYLSMRFKQQTGISPIDYLIRIRIDEAKRLLRETEASLRDISAHVGYADEYYFNRLFKKLTGVSPGRYQSMERVAEKSEDRPFISSGLSIGVSHARRYICEYDNHYQLVKSKPANMLGKLLNLTMLLTAASSDTTTKPATRTIATVKGDVVIPAEPTRVVVLYLLGDAVALGVKPIGISDVYEGAAFMDEVRDVQGVGHCREANPEDVSALDPDLIIVASEDIYEKLKDIAPTVLIPFDQMTSEERIYKMGEVFGKEQEAQALVNNFNAKVARNKGKLRTVGILDKTVTIIEGGKQAMSVVGSEQYGRGSQVIYEYLGMKAPEPIQQRIDTSTTAESEVVSMEGLPPYVGDLLLRSSWEGMEDLSGNRIWNRIPAVQTGNVIEIEFGLFYYSDIYSLNTQMDVITDMLLATVTDN